MESEGDVLYTRKELSIKNFGSFFLSSAKRPLCSEGRFKVLSLILASGIIQELL